MDQVIAELIAEPLAELQKIERNRFRFFITPHGNIRAEDDYQRFYCPITALAQQKLGKYYDPKQYLEAAEAMGWSRVSASFIMGASDNRERPKDQIRPHLLTALGLA